MVYGTLNLRRVLIPQNVDIIVHIPFGELIVVCHYIRCNKEPMTYCINEFNFFSLDLTLSCLCSIVKNQMTN